MTTPAPRDSQVPPAGPQEGHDLKIWSCVTCRRRKVKCDRRDPCANCIRNNIECHFPVTGRLPRRSRDPNAGKSPAQKQTELIGRLRRLENLVTELAGQVEDKPNDQMVLSQFMESSRFAPGKSTGAPRPDDWSTGSTENRSSTSGRRELNLSTTTVSTADSTDGNEVYEDFGRLVIDRGGSLEVDKGFWSIFCSEVESIFQALHDSSYDAQATLNESRQEAQAQTGRLLYVAPHCHGFVFGEPCQPSSATLDDLSPLPSQMLYIWKSYVDNVDPFIKILHIPTMNGIISTIRGKLSSLGREMETLLFAVSLAAAVSLDEDEVAESFRRPKSELISGLRLGTERALAHSQFLSSKDLTVFQAHVLYIATLPHIGSSQLAISLTGSLVRVAGLLRLNVDPSNSSAREPLTDVEIETRRRLWWQVCFIDSRSRDPRLPDLSVAEKAFDTCRPLNIDDQRLENRSSDVAVSSTQSTQMTLTLIRCENWLLYRFIRCRLDAPLETHIRFLEEARSAIETNHLQHLRPENDFDSMIKTMCALFFAKIEQGIHRHSLRMAKQNGQGIKLRHDPDMLAIFFKSSITILDTMHELGTNPAWRRWRWQLKGQFPWHTVGAVFIQVCQLPWTTVSEQAWALASKLFGELPRESEKEILWGRLNNLAEIAAAHRKAQMTRLCGNQSANLPSESDESSANTFGTVMSGAPSDQVDPPSFPSSSLHEGSSSMYWTQSDGSAMAETYGDSDFSSIISAALATKDSVSGKGGNLAGMTDVPAEWLDWDDVLNMDMF